MIQQTVERSSHAGLDKTWIITNEYLAHEIADQLPGLPAGKIVQEPVARNTAPACGLAAFLIERENPRRCLHLPSDHVIADEPRFLKLCKGHRVARPATTLWCWGLSGARRNRLRLYRDRRFCQGRFRAARPPLYREAKPEPCEEFVAAENYYWNSGMFIWSARTLADAVREHLPETAPLLESIAAAYGTPQFNEVFRALYPKMRKHFGGLRLLEPRSAKGEHLSHLYCVPAEFSWNDLGSWTSL